MNNSLYTSNPPTLDDFCDIVTPDMMEKDYMLEFAPVYDTIDDPVEDINANMIDHIFYKTNYFVCVTSRPIKDNPFKCTWGLETPKIDLQYLLNILDDMGIEYNVKEGAFQDVNGRWTHKSFNFVELKNPEKAYRTIYNKQAEIPVLVEGDSI